MPDDVDQEDHNVENEEVLSDEYRETSPQAEDEHEVSDSPHDEQPKFDPEENPKWDEPEKV